MKFEGTLFDSTQPLRTPPGHSPCMEHGPHSLASPSLQCLPSWGSLWPLLQLTCWPLGGAVPTLILPSSSPELQVVPSSSEGGSALRLAIATGRRSYKTPTTQSDHRAWKHLKSYEPKRGRPLRTASLLPTFLSVLAVPTVESWLLPTAGMVLFLPVSMDNPVNLSVWVSWSWATPCRLGLKWKRREWVELEHKRTSPSPW